MKKMMNIKGGISLKGVVFLMMAAVLVGFMTGDSGATYDGEGLAIFTKDIMPGARYCDWGSSKFPNYCAGDAYGDCTSYNELTPDTCGIGKDCRGDSCCNGTFYAPTIIPYGGNRWVIKGYEGVGWAFANQYVTFPNGNNPIVPDANTDLPVDCSKGPVASPPAGTVCPSHRVSVAGCSNNHNANGYQLFYEKWNSVTQKYEGLVEPDQMSDKVSWHKTAKVPTPFSASAAKYLYVADTGNNRVKRLGDKGTELDVFGSAESKFSYPRGVAVDSDNGFVYVVDKKNHMVQKFDKEGVFQTRWGAFGTVDGFLSAPQGVAVDSSGNVYVADTGNNRIQKFSSTGAFVSKFGTAGTSDGQFNSPQGVAVDSSGNIYVADTGNNRIQKFNSAGVFQSKFGSSGGGNSQFNSPQGVAVDTSGNIYVADTLNNRIQKIGSSSPHTFKKLWGNNGTDGWRLSGPVGVAVDKNGFIYVTDSNNKTVKKFQSDSTNSDRVDLIVKWGFGGIDDGQFDNPTGVAVDSSGHVYVADTGNYRIQKFEQSGINLQVRATNIVWTPQGMTVDASNNVYIADRNHHNVLKFDSSGDKVLTLGKSNQTSGNANGELNYPLYVALDASGNIYVSEWGNHRVQKFSPTGNFIDKYGSNGPAGDQFNEPHGIAIDSSGNFYVADHKNNAVKQWDSSGHYLRTIGTYGNGDGQFYYPKDVAVDSSGNIYVADTANNRIQKFDAIGGFLSKWGTYGTSTGQFNYPSAIAIDSQDNVYVSDENNRRIQIFDKNGVYLEQRGFNPDVNPGIIIKGLAVDPQGNLSVTSYEENKIYTFSGKVMFLKKWGSRGELNEFYQSPQGLAIDASGNIFIADKGKNRIQIMGASGTVIATWGSFGTSSSQFDEPSGVAVDSLGNIYVADKKNHRIQKFTGYGTFKKQWGSFGAVDSQFSSPESVAVDTEGNVYVADTGNNRIQKFTKEGVFIKQWGSLGPEDGNFNTPKGIAVDKTGVYVADTGNNRIQRFDLDGTFQKKWNTTGLSPDALSGPIGVAVDGLGNVYVADTGNNRILAFNKDGNFDSNFSASGQFSSPSGVGIFTGGSFVNNYSCYGYRDESGTMHEGQCFNVSLKALDQNTVITWIYTRIFNVAAWCKTGPLDTDTCTSVEAGIIPKSPSPKRETSDLVANGLTPSSYTAQAKTSFLRGDDRYVLTGRTERPGSSGTMPAYLETQETLNTFDYALHGNLEFDWNYKRQHKVTVSFGSGLPENLWDKAGANPAYGENWKDHGVVINPNVNFIVSDPSTGNLYQCDSWTGTGNIGTGSCTDNSSGICSKSSGGYTIDGTSTITWDCRRKLIINIDTRGLPDTIKNVSAARGFSPAVNPAYGSRLNKAETFTAPNMIYDQSNGVRYILTGWEGSGAVTATGQADSASATGLTSASISVAENTQNSKIIWVYRKEIQVRVNTTGLSATIPVYDKTGNLTAGNATINNVPNLSDFDAFKTGSTMNTDGMVYGNGILPNTRITGFDNAAGTMTLSKAPIYSLNGALLTIQWLKDSPGSARECSTGSAITDCMTWADIDSNSNWLRSGMNYYSEDTRITMTALMRLTDSGTPRTLTSNTISSVVTPLDWYEQPGTTRYAGIFTLKEPFAITWNYGDTKSFQIGQAVECPSPEVTGITCTEIDYAVAPVVTIKADNPANDSVSAFFHWSQTDGRLFPIRPVGSFSIKWKKTAAAGGGYTAELYGMSTWPAHRQTHLAQIPVTIQPSRNHYSFAAVKYPLVGAAVTNGIFNCETPGTRSVLLFDDPDPKNCSNDESKACETNSDCASPGTCSRTAKSYRAKFLVVETKSVIDYTTSNTSCIVGNDIVDGAHQDPEQKNGYVLNARSVYDGYGQDKAYDREARTGNIIAVNTVASSGVTGIAEPLTIVWYDKTKNSSGAVVQPEIGWPVKAVNYTCSWPASPDKIIIASGLGSGDKLSGFSDVKVYNQSDKTQPGFNPNEEHAKVINGKVYALRNDLNATDNYSLPYTLVKYKNTSGWHIKVFKVEDIGTHCEGARCAYYDFSRYITAGSPVLPVPPLGLLPIMAANNKIVPGTEAVVGPPAVPATSGGSEWHHLDHKGGHWAKAANWKGDLITAVVSKDADTIYKGSSDFGVLLSTDSGTTWVEYNTGLTDKGVRGLGNIGTALYAATKTGVFRTIIPNDPSDWSLMTGGPVDVRSIVAVAGAVYAGNPEGVWKYDTVASSWAQTNSGLTNTDIRTLVISPANAYLYAGTSGGIFKSTDSGNTWAAANSGLADKNIRSLSANANRIFAATPSGVFVSTNNGTSWSLKEITYGPVDQPVKTRVQSVIAQSSGAALWAGTDRGLFRSDDGGDTWSAIADSVCPSDSTDCLDYSVRSLAFSSNNSKVYAGMNKGKVAGSTITNNDWSLLADSAGAGSRSRFSMYWYYPMQPEFYMPGGGSVNANSPVPFMSGTKATDNPRPFEYIVHWPDDNDPGLGALRVGDTLMKAKNGCPDLSNQAAVQVIFDEGMNRGWGPLAKLMNPVARREVDLKYTLVDFPAEIKTQNNNGIVTFPDLPFYLRSRVSFDPNTQKLSFKGSLDESGAGEPLLLPNVMSEMERDTLKAQAFIYKNFREGKLIADTTWINAVNALYAKTNNPNDLTYTAGTAYINPYNPADAYTATNWVNKWGILLGLDKATGSVNKTPQPLKLLEPGSALTAGAAKGEGYVTLALNDDESLGAAPVDLKIIRISGPPVRGEIKIIKSDNLFDEKLTLRHGSDFGFDPSKFVFEWYYKGDESGDAPQLPTDGSTTGWTLFDRQAGLQSITIEGTGPMILADNWFMVRYYYGGVPVSGVTTPVYPAPVSSPPLCTGGVIPCNGESSPQDSRNWSQWAGGPPPETTAQLAEGWIKRVFGSLNLFDSRVTDFHNNETNTTVSMISQIGQGYEGDIALNSSAANLNSIGLLEAYLTVFYRGLKFSVDGVPPVNDGPTNNALLNAASKIAGFYMLLGNEAYGDAQDPTIGFTTKSGQFGTAAPTIFAFQNQLPTLLDEELALLRGRDSVGSKPVYNRLFWNFTQGDGEVAYVKTYNITNQNTDGIVNEYDARKMYPQGHGDAWGYYLSAIKTYYYLLNNQNFTWVPRPESVTVAGKAIKVDYMDERKFAQIAAQRAKTGTEIVDLTYRQSYVDDPAGQWQGYKDTDTSRAWGVDEWSRRTGQAAYFDWAVANALLPEKDQDPAHTGVSKIDRTTVQELRTIATEHTNIQSQADKMNKGLNPLGLAKGVVPFDIDPALISPSAANGGQSLTHFEQVYKRAEEAMKNAIAVFDYANTYTNMLRQNQDTLEKFKVNIKAQEVDYKNRLIEIFGYPYPEDIGSGAGKTYPAGYDGPDYIHYMYVDVPELTGEVNDMEIKRYSLTWDWEKKDYDRDLGLTDEDASKEVVFEVPKGEGWVSKPAGWTKRRAPGKIQNALSEVIKAHAQFKTGFREFESALDALQRGIDGLNETFSCNLNAIQVMEKSKRETLGMEAAIKALELLGEGFAQTMDTVEDAAEAVATAAPTSVGIDNDVGAPIRALAETAKISTKVALNIGSLASKTAASGMQYGIDVIEKNTEFQVEIDDRRKEVKAAFGEHEGAFLSILEKKQNLFTLQSVIDQKLGDFRAALAEGQRLIEQRADFRQKTAGDVQSYRYEDMSFRVFRNDALQKYKAQFDLAARYVYLAATAYDYETNLLGTESGAGRQFFTDIVKQRSLGEMIGGLPQAGRPGLADPMARLSQNFAVYKTQLGFNNPQSETNRFSLRKELFRIKPDVSSDANWRGELKKYRVADLWNVPEFRKFCREFAPESAGAQPGLVIPFNTNVTFGNNFFGWPLAGGDSAYDPSHFATRVRSVGVWFKNYDATGLSYTPRVYLIPAGEDVLRSPSGDGFAQRRWQVVDQKLPVPYPIGTSTLSNPNWIPVNDSLSEDMGGIRKISSLRAYHDSGSFNPAETTSDSRLIGRSVWNTKWMLIIPGGTLLNNANTGLDTLINTIGDIKLFFQTYSYSGN